MLCKNILLIQWAKGAGQYRRTLLEGAIQYSKAKMGSPTTTPRTTINFTAVVCCLSPDKFSYHIDRSCCWQFGWATNCVILFIIMSLYTQKAFRIQYITYAYSPFSAHIWWPVLIGLDWVCHQCQRGHLPLCLHLKWPQLPLCCGTGPEDQQQNLYIALTVSCNHSVKKTWICENICKQEFIVSVKLKYATVLYWLILQKKVGRYGFNPLHKSESHTVML